MVTTGEIFALGFSSALGRFVSMGFMARPMQTTIGTVNLARIVDESPRAQELSELLSKRYNELITQFNLGTEPTEEDVDRAERERLAYSQYLAYRQELEQKFQEEVDRAVREVAKDKRATVVVDDDVVRYGGTDLTDEVIKRLK